MNPFYQGAHFLTAATCLAQAPEDRGHEVVLAGRSNAGKSSAINALCHQRSLARTSKTPGRTQQLIFFELDAERRLVDLPGYGYARVSEQIKLGWQTQMADYLERRRSISALVIVMDIRHPLTEFDRQMLAWCQGRERPVLLLLTKADKLKRGAVQATRLAVEHEARQVARGEVHVIPFSAVERSGVPQVQALLDQWLAVPRVPPTNVGCSN